MVLPLQVTPLPSVHSADVYTDTSVYTSTSIHESSRLSSDMPVYIEIPVIRKSISVRPHVLPSRPTTKHLLLLLLLLISIVILCLFIITPITTIMLIITINATPVGRAEATPGWDPEPLPDGRLRAERDGPRDVNNNSNNDNNGNEYVCYV